MDLRVDLSEVWDNLQTNGEEKIIIKLVLPSGTEQECTNYLNEKEVTKYFLFPD